MIFGPEFDRLLLGGVLKVDKQCIRFIPCNHHQKKIKAADASLPRGEAICRRDRYWKREPVKNAEAGRIAAQTRIPSLELSAMSAARPFGSWIPFKDRKLHQIAHTIL